MRYAIIDNGTVSNVVKATSELAASNGWVEAPAGVARGWTYDGSFHAPVPEPDPVPGAITRYQFKKALLDLNSNKLDDLLTYISGLSAAEQLEWRERRLFFRNSDLINNAAAALSVSSNAVDNLFRDAAAIED